MSCILVVWIDCSEKLKECLCCCSFRCLSLLYYHLFKMKRSTAMHQHEVCIVLIGVVLFFMFCVLLLDSAGTFQ